MNLCLVLFQAIMFAVLLVQYQFTNEVGAENTSFSVGGWFNSMERKMNIKLLLQVLKLLSNLMNPFFVVNQLFPYDDVEYVDTASYSTNENGVMSDVYHSIKKTAENIVRVPRRRFTHKANPVKSEEINDDDLVINQELAEMNAIQIDDRDLTNKKDNMNDVFLNIRKNSEDIVRVPRRHATYTDNLNKNEDINYNELVNNQELAEINATEIDASDVTDEKNYTETENSPLKRVRKKRVRKHKKKSKVQREKTADVSAENDEAEFSRRMRKEHKKKPRKRTFVKMYSNNSESDENVKRGGPVDIIVHIKMNE